MESFLPPFLPPAIPPPNPIPPHPFFSSSLSSSFYNRVRSRGTWIRPRIRAMDTENRRSKRSRFIEVELLDVVSPFRTLHRRRRSRSCRRCRRRRCP